MAQTAAARQKAYRDRRREINRFRADVGFGPVPPVRTAPNFKRWRQLSETITAAAQAIADELTSYYDERSEGWRDSSRGYHLAAQLELVESIRDQADELAWEYPD